MGFNQLKGMLAGDTREFEEDVVLESEKDFIATVVPFDMKKEGQAQVRPSILKNGKHFLSIQGPARVALTQASDKVKISNK